MIKHSTSLNDCYVLEPKVFGDARGYFYESFNQKVFNELVGKDVQFVQDNQSRSALGVLRGLHLQTSHTQGKLVRVISGEVYDVAVDLRKNSSTFGKHFGLILSAENKKMLWIPEGFAHGFLVLSETAEFVYKTTDYYHPASEVCLRWNDPTLEINWPKTPGPFLKEKDAAGLLLKDCPTF